MLTRNPSHSNAVYEAPLNTRTQSLLTSLRSPIASLDDLETLLLDILSAIDSVPESFSRPRYTNFATKDVLSVLPTVHHLTLSVLLPTWLAPLREAGHLRLVKHVFCPPPEAGFHGSERKSQIVTTALPIILAHLPALVSKDQGPTAILDFCFSLVEEIITAYPLDVIFSSLVSPPSGGENTFREDRRIRDWEDYVRVICSVPGKVANAMHERKEITRRELLQHGPYFASLCVSTERLIYNTQDRTLIRPQTHLISKLLNLGFFPRVHTALPSQPSFFICTLPTIYHRDTNASYSEAWTSIVHSLPSTSQQTFVTSLLGALDCTVGLDTSSISRRKVRDAGRVLRMLLGTMREEDAQLWSTVVAVVCASQADEPWNMGVLRAVVVWIAEPQLHEKKVTERALDKLLDATLATWTDATYIRHSLLSRHRYTTSLLLLTLNLLPRAATRMALSPPLISSITVYLAHLDESVRRCGMLVAEVVAQQCNKTLAFGGWDGDSEGSKWAACMRGWVNDWDVEEADFGTKLELGREAELPAKKSEEIFSFPRQDGYDSDDSLTGYGSPSSRSSSRPPSPTESEIAEMEKDPTIRPRKPIQRPVYIAQLAPMLRADQGTEEDAVERVAAALDAAEGLVRRKKGFGLELEENAVEVTIALIGLHDSYELPEFDTKHQAALVALVACCPRKAALTLIEQFFTNQYGIAQRIAILAALALGARELAGLPVPDTPRKDNVFPSKMLPPTLHRRYYIGEVQNLLKDISKRALMDREMDEETSAPAVRSKQLRVGRLGSTRVTSLAAPGGPSEKKETFTEVAAEFFIMPLINHMWRHLRAHGSSAGVGVGTGLVLTPVVLAQYLGTLAVLIHASRHAPAYLAVISPSAIELALILGTQTASKDRTENDDSESDAAVLIAALEAILVVLDGCIALDSGRELALGKTALLLAVDEWVGEVVGVLAGGRRVSGQGGTSEGRLAAAVAGVLEKLANMRQRWGRSMIAM